MGNTTTGLVLVMFINVLLFLAQATTYELNPAGNSTFYTYEGSVLKQMDANKNQFNPMLNSTAYTDEMPEQAVDMGAASQNYLTDIWANIKTWFMKKTGLTYIKHILSAPYTVLASLHLPSVYVFGIGSLWYAITFFLIVSFLWGRE